MWPRPKVEKTNTLDPSDSVDDIVNNNDNDGDTDSGKESGTGSVVEIKVTSE